jgi:hypothetical protein
MTIPEVNMIEVNTNTPEVIMSIPEVNTTYPKPKSSPNKLAGFKSLTPIPTVLHIYHESRREDLKVYETVFKVKDKEGVQRGEIYIDPAIHTLLVKIPYWTQPWYRQTCVWSWQLGESDETGSWQASQHRIFKIHVKSPP